jgi:hypothetical protein
MQYPVQLTQIGAEKAIYIPAYEAVKAIYVGPIKNTELPLRKKWLDKIETLGKNLK